MEVKEVKTIIADYLIGNSEIYDNYFNNKEKTFLSFRTGKLKELFVEDYITLDEFDSELKKEVRAVYRIARKRELRKNIFQNIKN